jgi:hypothetical protein
MTALDLILVTLAGTFGVFLAHIVSMWGDRRRVAKNSPPRPEPRGLGYEDTDPMTPPPIVRDHPARGKIERRAQEIEHDEAQNRGSAGDDGPGLGTRLDERTSARARNVERIRRALAQGRNPKL